MAQICLLILESQGLKSGTQKLLISLKRHEALAIRLACRCDSKLTEHHKPLKKKEQEMEAPHSTDSPLSTADAGAVLQLGLSIFLGSA